VFDKMTSRPKTAPEKKRQPPAAISSKTIAEQTEVFLKAGGKIEHIKSGVSGQQNLQGPRHISLGNKPA